MKHNEQPPLIDEYWLGVIVSGLALLLVLLLCKLLSNV